MAKPLSLKSRIIRKAIQVHPNLTNKELAEKLNASAECKQEDIEVTPLDVSQQKVALKKLGVKGTAPEAPKAEAAAAEPAPRKRMGRPKGSGKRKAPSTLVVGNPVDLIDQVFTLAQACGGLAGLKKLVDRLEGMGR